MQHEQRVCDIHQHVQRFPNGCAQVGEPKVVTGRRHEEQDYQREKAEWLERDAGNRTVERAAFEDAQDGLVSPPA